MQPLTPLAEISIILSWLFVGLACTSTGMQLVWIFVIAKLRIRTGDICLYAALLIGILLVAQMTWAMVDEGSARHQSDISQQSVAAIAKSLIINEALWLVTGALIRVSGCCLFYTLFAFSTRVSNIVLALMGLCIIYGIASVLEICLLCRPVAAQWDPNIIGTCGNQIVAFVAIELSGLLLDLAILIIPSLFLWRTLDISIATKVKIIMLLDAGVLLLIITSLRIKALQLAVSADFTYSKSYLGLLSSVGSMLGVVFCTVTVIPGVVSAFKERYKIDTRTPSIDEDQHSQSNSTIAKQVDHRDV